MARRNTALPEGRRHKLRCAVYTRKSSEEGLEQSFNSLHAQRDACEAFIASQIHEGWRLLPEAYDDGGLSGGSMERPALKRLLGDVRSGLIDIVVVYKVDRLTRSLADFAKLTELFEAHGTSFVSVTQAFNTSTSMGRLTLNVLLSFAQFEREVAGERIRDKIALSKRRGMWMGGLPPLGYDGVDRKLVINEPEAETVREIFRRYLEVGSIAILKRSLDAEGIVSKRRRFRDGKEMGGVSLSRGALYQILRNRLYRGEIEHRGEVHQGEHKAIIPDKFWSDVQARLADQSHRPRGSKSRAASAPLAGLLFDSDGNRMSPTYAIKSGRRYRYYTSAPLVRGTADGKGMRVPAPDVERLVVTTIADHLTDPQWLAGIARGAELSQLTRIISSAQRLYQSMGEPAEQELQLKAILQIIERIGVAEDSVTLAINRMALGEALEIAEPDWIANIADVEEPIEIAVAIRLQRCGKQVRLILGEVSSKTRLPHADLVQLVRDGHRWFEDLRCGRAATIAAIARRDRHQVSHVSRNLSLAFLAPDITEMILTGRQPITLTPERLKAARPLPPGWNEQRAILLD
ncbi:recombinase family protein [Aurantimonas sp. A3-2-R12]|uniref:recombinase family protein n=1 Tax=Aurantimonas sp. A3-2-R12 TaxID=3114362 RepID=UPI002E198398|nr:recombinase family protein [Aurantimonas sp. A3-2-R12]